MQLEKKRDRLERMLGGIRGMERAPGLVFVVDTAQSDIAIKEANKLKIPVVAIIDTNRDPDPVDHPIPGNDDAIRSIRLFTHMVADAVIEGRAMMKDKEKTEKAKAEKAAADKAAAEKAKSDGVVEKKSAGKAAKRAKPDTETTKSPKLDA